MTLFGKGLVVIGLPLIFEVIFVLILSFLLKQAALDATLVEHRYQALKGCQKIAASWMLLESLAEKYFLSGDRRYLDITNAPLTDIKAEFNRMFSENSEPWDTNHLTALRDLLKLQVKDLSTWKAESRYESVARTRQTGTLVLIELRSLSTDAERMLNARTLHQSRLRESTGILIALALSFNFLLAVALAVFFSKSITSRVNILSDNTQRLSRGSPLNAPVKGADEISVLDRAFHGMAAALEKAAGDLAGSEQRMRTIIATMPVGLITIGASGQIEAANPMAQKIFGYSGSELIGAALSKVIPSLSPEILSTTVEKQKGAAQEPDSFDGLRKDGVKFSVDVSTSEFATDNRRLVLAGIQDISLRRRIEQLKQEFLSMVSHDLRTPLTSVELTLNMLRQGVYGHISESGLKSLADSQSNIHRLISLVNDLLDLEKMDSGKLTMDFDYARVSHLIERSVESIRPQAEQKNISIVTPQTRLAIAADEDRLVQVLSNLLANAISYCPPDSVVQIDLQKEDSSIELSVSDSGIAVGEAFSQAVFERFQAGNQTECPRRQGAGVALTICRAIIEAHGGTIGVRASQPQGNTFFFRLPIAQDEDGDGQV